MSEKNAFEIRLELLAMAKEMMDRNYEEASQAYWLSVNTLAEKWNKSAIDLIEQTKNMKPIMYSPQEIMDKAKELYKFVETGK